MSFKIHRMGDKNKSPAEELEAEFHQRIKFIISKKYQGYVMGEFRKALQDFTVEFKSKD